MFSIGSVVFSRLSAFPLALWLVVLGLPLVPPTFKSDLSGVWLDTTGFTFVITGFALVITGLRVVPSGLWLVITGFSLVLSGFELVFTRFCLDGFWLIPPGFTGNSSSIDEIIGLTVGLNLCL